MGPVPPGGSGLMEAIALATSRCQVADPDSGASYRLAWAVADALAPATIADLAPDADDTTAGLRAARPQADFLDSGSISPGVDRLPGETWDLVRVAGTGDGDTVFHQLRLAARQGSFVLVDGYTTDRTDFLATNEFLFYFGEELAGWWVLSGRQGLLIEIGSGAGHIAAGDGTGVDSSATQDLYGRSYFLDACGGHEAYNRSSGRHVDDQRLAVVACLAGLWRPQRVLDLWCGRGELTFHFARRGAAVTAVDYSADAIALTEACVAAEPELGPRVTLLRGDACTIALDGGYDVAIASDLIEHLSPAELDTLYPRLATALGPRGVFVVHTFPNHWFYSREYERRRARVRSAGGYLSPEPRIRYERLMHINEQAPDVLVEQLSRHFDHVVVWAGDPHDPRGSLAMNWSQSDIEAAPDLFAVASSAPIDVDTLAAALSMRPLEPAQSQRLWLEPKTVPTTVRAGERFEATVRLGNDSDVVLSSNPPNPFHLSYHWFGDDGTMAVTNGDRNRLVPWLVGGDAELYAMTVLAPPEPDRYELQLTAVQEQVQWFDGPASPLAAAVTVTVEGTPGRR